MEKGGQKKTHGHGGWIRLDMAVSLMVMNPMPLDPYNESSKKHTKSQDACGTFHAPFLMKLDLGVIQNDLGAVPKIVAPAPVSAACGSCKAGS